MKMVAIADHPEHVCARYRLWPLVSTCASLGHTLEIVALPHGVFNRRRLWNSLLGTDVILLQRKLLPWWDLYQLRKACDTFIFDLDDAIFQRDSYSPKGSYSSKRWRRFRGTMKLADMVFAGNRFLIGKAMEAGAKESAVHYVPSCVDPSIYPVHPVNDTLHPELAWIGSTSTLRGLDQQSDLWSGLGREFPQLKFRIICDSFPKWPDVNVICVPWKESSEAAELAQSHIGISWIPEDDWSRGKCGLKVLQYMAAGLPVIANPVGVHVDMIRHGVNGFLASTLEEWKLAVKMLTQDVEMRQWMGKASRKFVEEHYSVTVLRKLWLRALKLDLPESQAA